MHNILSFNVTQVLVKKKVPNSPTPGGIEFALFMRILQTIQEEETHDILDMISIDVDSDVSFREEVLYVKLQIACQIDWSWKIL